MKFADPKNDLAFKKIFGNEDHKDILISFLNSLLDFKDEKTIVDINLLNPRLRTSNPKTIAPMGLHI